MSIYAFTFHSSEADNPATLARGWYIGFCQRYGDMTTDGAIGPYASEEKAIADLPPGFTCTRKLS